jgi:hypothetical protein
MKNAPLAIPVVRGTEMRAGAARQWARQAAVLASGLLTVVVCALVMGSSRDSGAHPAGGAQCVQGRAARV